MITPQPVFIGFYAATNVYGRATTKTDGTVNMRLVLIGWPVGDPLATWPLDATDDESAPLTAEVNPTTVSLYDLGEDDAAEVLAVQVSRNGLDIQFQELAPSSDTYMIRITPDTSWPMLENETLMATSSAFRLPTLVQWTAGEYFLAASRPRQTLLTIAPGEFAYRVSFMLSSYAPLNKRWKTVTDAAISEVTGEVQLKDEFGNVLGVVTAWDMADGRINFEFTADFEVIKGHKVQLVGVDWGAMPTQDGDTTSWAPYFAPWFKWTLTKPAPAP